jgi:hypothetical protein
VDDTERIREIADSIIEKSGDAATIKSAAELLRLASEIENRRADVRKLAAEEQKIGLDLSESRRSRKSEDWKTYITLLAPVFTTVVLAATLVSQSYQFNQSEKDKQAEARRQAESAEDVRWSDAIKLLSESDKISPTGALLKSFVKSDRYGDQAYKTAIQELIQTEDPERFNSLFDSIFQPVDWSTLPQVVELDRTLWSSLDPLLQKSYDRAKNVNDLNILDATDRKKVSSLNSHLELITRSIAPVLKGPRPSGTTLDLSSTDLVNADFQGANLKGAKLERVTFSGVNIKDADFSGITEFAGSKFFSSPWWQVSHINQDFLEYLAKNYSCDTSLDASGQPPSPDACKKGIASLQESASKQ